MEKLGFSRSDVFSIFLVPSMSLDLVNDLPRIVCNVANYVPERIEESRIEILVDDLASVRRNDSFIFYTSIRRQV